MADEQWFKSNMVFGSAGMAASGMLPKPLVKARPKPLPAAPAVIELETETVVEPAAIEETLEVFEVREEIETPEIEASAAIEEIETIPTEPISYGINSKAQRLFSNFKVGVISFGTRNLDGFDWDGAFRGINGLKVEGVSDPTSASLLKMREVYGVNEGYGDYRELLANTRPHLVAIPQMGTARRHEMIKNCLMAGSHVICTAPFTRTLGEADELMALASRRGLKVSVALPMRLDPNVNRFLKMRDAVIGDLVEIRIFGEMDQAAGGEDLLTRGAPLFDLARMFAGDPIWASATSLTDGARSTRQDVIEGPERPWGPLVGDTINAQLYMENDVFVSFVSNRKLRDVTCGWGMEFIGSRNVMRLFAGVQPTLSLMQNPGEKSPSGNECWSHWPESASPYHPTVDDLEGPEAALRLVVADWLEGISNDNQPQCSAENATKSLEMVHGVFQSAISGKRSFFPLANRHHPLAPEIKPYEMEYKATA